MQIMRDALFTAEAKEATYFFINDNGEQFTVRGEERVKETIQILKGKLLLPEQIEREDREDYNGSYTTYSFENQNYFLYITFEKQK